MEELVCMAYEAATVLAPFFVALALSSRSCKRHGILLGTRYYVLAVIFAVYILGVLNVTGSGTLFDLLYHGFERTPNVNLIPFSQTVAPLPYALNVVMFIPLGILVPALWPRLDRWPAVLASGFGLVALIELSQLCNFRSTDVDDVIMNVLGAALGYLIFLVAKKLRGAGKAPNTSAVAPSYQLPLYVGVMFLGRFFLYDFMGFGRLFDAF